MHLQIPIHGDFIEDFVSHLDQFTVLRALSMDLTAIDYYADGTWINTTFTKTRPTGCLITFNEDYLHADRSRTFFADHTFWERFDSNRVAGLTIRNLRVSLEDLHGFTRIGKIGMREVTIDGKVAEGRDVVDYMKKVSTYLYSLHIGGYYIMIEPIHSDPEPFPLFDSFQ
jgi:hypothetical protein